MKPRNVILFLVLLCSIFIFAGIFLKTPTESEEAEETVSFELNKIAFAGNSSYIIYNSNGGGTLEMISLKRKPHLSLTVYLLSQGIGMASIDDFVSDLSALEGHGFTFEAKKFLPQTLDSGLLVVPQGAMPLEILSGMEGSDSIIIYIGKKDAIIGANGVETFDWYASLPEEKKERIIVYDMPLDEFYTQENMNSLLELIVFGGYAEPGKSSKISLSDGLNTFAVPLEGAEYVRIIYEREGTTKIFDSVKFYPSTTILTVDPVFPNEKAFAYFSLQNIVGTPTFSIYKDGSLVSSENLPSSGEVFSKTFQFSEPGCYILKVSDYEKELASGIFHVYDLRFEYLESNDIFYKFSASLDGVPLDGKTIQVSLDSSKNVKSISIANGEFTVPAKLSKGGHIFNFELEGHKLSVEVLKKEEGPLSVYMTYGPIAIIFVIIVYIGAKMIRRPFYKLKFGIVRAPTSGEVVCTSNKMLKLFEQSVQKSGSFNTLSVNEFALFLKAHLTDGYDIREGNAETILKRLEGKGLLESYQSIYQLKGNGNVKKNVLHRLIKEKLIVQGVHFAFERNKFVTRNADILLPGTDSGQKRTIIVFEDRNAIDSYLSLLSPSSRSNILIKVKNGLLTLTTLRELEDQL